MCNTNMIYTGEFFKNVSSCTVVTKGKLAVELFVPVCKRVCICKSTKEMIPLKIEKLNLT